MTKNDNECSLFLQIQCSFEKKKTWIDKHTIIHTLACALFPFCEFQTVQWTCIQIDEMALHTTHDVYFEFFICVMITTQHRTGRVYWKSLLRLRQRRNGSTFEQIVHLCITRIINVHQCGKSREKEPIREWFSYAWHPATTFHALHCSNVNFDWVNVRKIFTCISLRASLSTYDRQQNCRIKTNERKKEMKEQAYQVNWFDMIFLELCTHFTKFFVLIADYHIR